MTSLSNSIVAKEGPPAKSSAWKPNRRDICFCPVSAGYIIENCVIFVAHAVAAFALPCMWGVAMGLAVTHLPEPASFFAMFLVSLFSIVVVFFALFESTRLTWVGMFGMAFALPGMWGLAIGLAVTQAPDPASSFNVIFLASLFSFAVVFFVFIESTRLTWVGMFGIAMFLEQHLESRNIIQTKTPNVPNLLVINDDNVALPNPWHPTTIIVTVVWLLHLSWTFSILFEVELPLLQDHPLMWLPMLAAVKITPRLLARPRLGREVTFCMLASSSTFWCFISLAFCNEKSFKVVSSKI